MHICIYIYIYTVVLSPGKGVPRKGVSGISRTAIAVDQLMLLAFVLPRVYISVFVFVGVFGPWIFREPLPGGPGRFP